MGTYVMQTKHMNALRGIFFAMVASACLAFSSGALASSVYDVRDFGARGDGVAKDTAAIQAAVDKESYVWGNVKFPFKNITFSNVDVDSEIETVNVDGLVISGGRLREKTLSSESRAKLSDDIANYRKIIF